MFELKDITQSSLRHLSEALSSLLKGGEVIGLTGPLGAGKTTFVKSLSHGLKIDSSDVVSPTFTLLNIYDAPVPVYHWDLYRLEDEKELLALDYEEYFYSKGICLIEWFDKLEQLKPSSYLGIHFEVASAEHRNITMSGHGKEALYLEEKVKEEIKKISILRSAQDDRTRAQDDPSSQVGFDEAGNLAMMDKNNA